MQPNITPNHIWQTHDRKAIQNHFRFERWNFRAIHGYRLDLQNPQSFSQKIVWKKIFDRNPLLPIISDKHRVREFVKDRLGAQKANAILIPQIAAISAVNEFDFTALPAAFIMKANHGSRMNLIKNTSDTPAPEKWREQAKTWLKKDFGVRRNEWCYQEIPRKIVFDELLQDENGHIPADIKLYTMNGKTRLIEVVTDRYEGRRKVNFFDENYQMISMKNGGRTTSSLPLPANIDEAVTIAHKLAYGFDQLRVDLYTTGQKIYFGELTNYSGSGRLPFKPRSTDFWLGAFWELDRSHERQI